MENNEFKNSLNKWTQSEFYKKFKEKLNERINRVLQLKFTKEEIMESKKKYNAILPKEELEALLDNIIYFDALPEKDKEDLEWTSEIIVRSYEKKDLYFEFIKTMANWYMYLSIFLVSEDYELCEKLKNVISIEMKDFKEVLKKYDNTYEETWDLGRIKEINNELKKTFEI